MSGELPEGVGVEDVREFAMVHSLCANLINLQSDYLTSEAGTPEEEIAEQALATLSETITGLGDETVGTVILSLVHLVVNTADEEKVQAWFDNQAALIKAALGNV